LTMAAESWRLAEWSPRMLASTCKSFMVRVLVV
jgi:hypothetical protein